MFHLQDLLNDKIPPYNTRAVLEWGEDNKVTK